MKKLLFILIFAVSCGSESEDAIQEIETASKFYATAQDLPDCNEQYKHKLGYVESTSTMNYCDGSTWIEIVERVNKARQIQCEIVLNDYYTVENYNIYTYDYEQASNGMSYVNFNNRGEKRQYLGESDKTGYYEYEQSNVVTSAHIDDKNIYITINQKELNETNTYSVALSNCR